MRKLVRLLTVACCAFALVSAAPESNRASGARPRPPRDPFILLLKGIYEPVAEDPGLGLSTVDLDDGTYSKCEIYGVSGIRGAAGKDIGDFYVNFDVTLCAYDLPDGAFAAVVTDFVFEFIEFGGEVYQVGTADLTIAEATGVYDSFVGGSIHMEFATRMIDEVTFDELCLCFISR